MEKRDDTPEYGKMAFRCPHCNVLAKQDYEGNERSTADYFSFLTTDGTFCFCITECSCCHNYCIWQTPDNVDKPMFKMIYPLVASAPRANEYMPDDVKEIYEEARQVSVHSPRAAAALLRVCLEKITTHLGETTGNLNTRIKNLKKKGLPEKVIKSLDIVRITANEGGSHAGEIDLSGEDNKKIVDKLFWLTNFIVEKTIQEPKEIDSVFDGLPEAKKKGIENRDNPANHPQS